MKEKELESILLSCCAGKRDDKKTPLSEAERAMML